MSRIIHTLVNGSPSDSLDVHDRGLQYGDGVFRTMRVRRGQVVFQGSHLSHLEAGCERLKIAFPGRVRLMQDVESLCGGGADGVLKIIVTRGASSRGYKLHDALPTVISILYAGERDLDMRNWRDGIAVRLCETRMAENPALAGIKHLNRLEQVLARSEWDDPDIAEGLVRNTDGEIVEGTASNVFIVADGILSTPDLSKCGVAGVMREMIMEAATETSRAMRIASMSVEDCLRADEMFVCNSVAGIWPVREFAARTWSRWPVTESLQRHFVGYFSES